MGSISIYSYLQQKRGWWIGSYCHRVGSSAREVKKGNNPSWNDYELVAATPCDSGTFRTRLAMYIRGSVSGLFYPYPGLYASLPRNLSC